MRTTISLDDHLAQAVRRDAPPVKLSTVSGVRLRPGIDLDQPRALEIQDDEREFLKGSNGSM